MVVCATGDCFSWKCARSLLIYTYANKASKKSNPSINSLVSLFAALTFYLLKPYDSGGTTVGEFHVYMKMIIYFMVLLPFQLCYSVAYKFLNRFGTIDVHRITDHVGIQNDITVVVGGVEIQVQPNALSHKH